MPKKRPKKIKKRVKRPPAKKKKPTKRKPTSDDGFVFVPDFSIFGTPDPVLTRFLSYVKQSLSGCWLWAGADLKGYGVFKLHHTKSVKAHRFSYQKAYGEIPPGLQLDHLCRKPLCVNPTHLEAVTPRVNVLRGDTITARNAAKTHCDYGHAFSGANLIQTKKQRYCRECRRRRGQIDAAKHRARARAQKQEAVCGAW